MIPADAVHCPTALPPHDSSFFVHLLRNIFLAKSQSTGFPPHRIMAVFVLKRFAYPYRKVLQGCPLMVPFSVINRFVIAERIRISRSNSGPTVSFSSSRGHHRNPLLFFTEEVSKPLRFSSLSPQDWKNILDISVAEEVSRQLRSSVSAPQRRPNI